MEIDRDCTGIRNGHLVFLKAGTTILPFKLNPDPCVVHLPHPTGGFEAAETFVDRQYIRGLYS